MVRAIHLRVLPETRGECQGGARPCPMVSCRHHLLLDVASDGRLRMTQDFDEADGSSIVEALSSMADTCALDVADKGGAHAEDVASILGVDPIEIEAVQAEAIGKLSEEWSSWDVPSDHPDDPYLRYTAMGADELAEVTAQLRSRLPSRMRKATPPCRHWNAIPLAERRLGCPRCHLTILADSRRSKRFKGG